MRACPRACAVSSIGSMASVGELRDELASMTGVQPSGRYDELAAELPLLHRCNEPERLLQDTALIPGTGSKHRQDLGLGGCVFFWVGRCAYDRCPLVLVWAPEAERAQPDGYGAPWDTGGLLTKGTLYPQISFDDALIAIERYSLPLATYRSYLSLVIETCFNDPADYLRNGVRRPRWYPGCRPPPIPDAGPPARTFEVRRAGSVEIATALVAIVPDESAFVDSPRTLRKLRQYAADVGAAWVLPRPGEPSHVAATRFVADFLRQRGIG
jgi:hypothetical protein